jgi:hypothetical protein
MNTPATTKIRMIQRSMDSLMLSLVGLVPVVGLPFSLAALYDAGCARVLEKTYWNPARTHRRLGVALGALGAVVWSVVDTLLMFQLLNDYLMS